MPGKIFVPQEKLRYVGKKFCMSDPSPPPLGLGPIRRCLFVLLVKTPARSWSFSYPEPFLCAVNGARRGALAKSIPNWHLIGYNEDYCSNAGYILLPCSYGIRVWIWPEPLVAPRVRRALGSRMAPGMVCFAKLLTDTANKRQKGRIKLNSPYKTGS
jgi:hypothetical protein